jgi:hypothetical protein
MAKPEMQMPEITGASFAANEGTTTSNFYVNINNMSTGTLTGSDVDPKLTKAERLLSFSYGMRREINSAAESGNLFSAGEIDASWVYMEILRTKSSIYSQNSFVQGNNLQTIKVYRADVINGQIKVTEELDFTNCIITQINTSVVSLEGQKLDTLKLWFRYTGWTNTLFMFNQQGQPIGQDVFSGDLTKGTLKAAGAAGGAGGGAAGGGAAGGGGGGGAGGGGTGGVGAI